MGARAKVSLLDQHSDLKKKAEGESTCERIVPMELMLGACFECTVGRGKVTCVMFGEDAYSMCTYIKHESLHLNHLLIKSMCNRTNMPSVDICSKCLRVCI